MLQSVEDTIMTAQQALAITVGPEAFNFAGKPAKPRASWVETWWPQPITMRVNDEPYMLPARTPIVFFLDPRKQWKTKLVVGYIPATKERGQITFYSDGSCVIKEPGKGKRGRRSRGSSGSIDFPFG